MRCSVRKMCQAKCAKCPIFRLLRIFHARLHFFSFVIVAFILCCCCVNSQIRAENRGKPHWVRCNCYDAALSAEWGMIFNVRAPSANRDDDDDGGERGHKGTIASCLCVGENIWNNGASHWIFRNERFYFFCYPIRKTPCVILTDVIQTAVNTHHIAIMVHRFQFSVTHLCGHSSNVPPNRIQYYSIFLWKTIIQFRSSHHCFVRWRGMHLSVARVCVCRANGYACETRRRK